MNPQPVNPNAEPADPPRPWPDFVARVPIGFARRHSILGVADAEGRPLFLSTDDTDPDVIDALRRRVCPAKLERWESDRLASAIESAYAESGIDTQGAIADIDVKAATQSAGADAPQRVADLLDDEGRAPVVKLVNALIYEAVVAEASDVHVQPRNGKTLVRLRSDGLLYDAFEFPAAVHEELVSRVKIMGGMDIAEKRLPQDGRASVRLGDREVDLRLSSVPTQHGERVVLRLLDQSTRRFSLDELGMPTRIREQFMPLIEAEHGLILVTGPTGSGKSTTLYGALRQVDATQLNVLTLEDPIEYQLENISQMQVASQRGMTFAKGLRSVLRQDPDIIMVGEIRDRETAELAIQAALTGHLVFSTLHTNDAASAVTRLIDLGVEPYLVASSLLGVMAQRLVRRVCDDCGEPLSEEQIAQELGRVGETPWVTPMQPRHGTGCEKCRGTGYRGRLGLFELLAVTPEFSELIGDRRPASELKRHAIAAGMTTLREDGAEKIARGLTTAEEVLRVTRRSSMSGDTGQDDTGDLPPLEAEGF
ncbi:GspE/PulE family protein [Algisphaera agarilytica]|uniref:General secretion pathway protein E n=1 Tax=Algisphaera agarilytica TaxID=1385975 RepID=A0A7X0LL13_9BACT|nr:ATPase, T2SS/T4P/T4SS family [Algisphaera agarilytica]MBB6429513.1 general secretion pathway protein E [Algisphaera agarilytica]